MEYWKIFDLTFYGLLILGCCYALYLNRKGKLD